MVKIEDVHNIIELAYKVQTETDHTVLLNFDNLLNWIGLSIRVYEGGLTKGKSCNFSCFISLDKPNVDNYEEYKETMEYLERIRKEVK